MTAAPPPTPSLVLPPDVALGWAVSDPEGGVGSSALTADERARLATFGHEERRRAFAMGRTAARVLLAQRLGCTPAEAPLVVAADGALDVEGHALHLSLAHAGRGAEARAVAVVAEGPIGVDLERVGPRRPDLWRRLLGPGESGVLDALGGPTDRAQTLVWTLKEAVLKGERTGFRLGARSVRLTLDGHGRARAHTARGEWRLAWGSFDAYVVAVAWRPDDERTI